MRANRLGARTQDGLFPEETQAAKDAFALEKSRIDARAAPQAILSAKSSTVRKRSPLEIHGSLILALPASLRNHVIAEPS